MIQRWWASSGIAGVLAEEYPVVRRQPPIQVRRLDAIVILDGGSPGRVIDRTDVPSLRGRDVVVVQCKASKLSEGLCGQAMGSILLAERHEPASVRSVLICAQDDPDLRPIVEAHGVEVVVVDVPKRPAAKVNPDLSRLARWAQDQGVPLTYDVRMSAQSPARAHAIAALDGIGPPARWPDFAGRELEILVAKLSGAREGSSFGMSPVGYAVIHRETRPAGGSSKSRSPDPHHLGRSGHGRIRRPLQHRRGDHHVGRWSLRNDWKGQIMVVVLGPFVSRPPSPNGVELRPEISNDTLLQSRKTSLLSRQPGEHHMIPDPHLCQPRDSSLFDDRTQIAIAQPRGDYPVEEGTKDWIFAAVPERRVSVQPPAEVAGPSRVQDAIGRPAVRSGPISLEPKVET